MHLTIIKKVKISIFLIIYSTIEPIIVEPRRDWRRFKVPSFESVTKTQKYALIVHKYKYLKCIIRLEISGIIIWVFPASCIRLCIKLSCFFDELLSTWPTLSWRMFRRGLFLAVWFSLLEPSLLTYGIIVL